MECHRWVLITQMQAFLQAACIAGLVKAFQLLQQQSYELLQELHDNMNE